MTIGLRVRPVTAPVAPAIAARAAGLPAANIGDVMNRMQCLSGTFHAHGAIRRVGGPAFTVKARSGDIIVCDGNGDLTVALMGDLMLGHATKRGIAGAVMDGAVRDVASLARMRPGVRARGHTPAGPWKEGPGEIGTPISCGGQVVMPGDLICCDQDGVVVVPREEAEAVIAAAERHQAKEVKAEAEIQAGSWPRGRVPEALRARGCEGA